MKIRYGEVEAPLISVDWAPAATQPYRCTYKLKPGASWFDAPISESQREIYVLDANQVAVPVGCLAIRSLLYEGASNAAFVEIFPNTVLVDESLTCISEVGELGEVIDTFRGSQGGRMAGFPDCFAVFGSGQIAFREIKRKGKDRLRSQQHKAADLLRDIYGDRADLAVIEW